MPILVEWTETGPGGKYTALVFDKVISDDAKAQAQAWLNIHKPHGNVVVIPEKENERTKLDGLRPLA
jgi:hypothetical protein